MLYRPYLKMKKQLPAAQLHSDLTIQICERSKEVSDLMWMESQCE